MSALYLRTPIDSGWQFKEDEENETKFLPVTSFPTVIHLDLLGHGKIPEPPKDRNSEVIQWVGEKKWLYRTDFNTPKASRGSRYAKQVLVFDGLDTFCTITLNGKEIQKTANMFLQYRVEVTDALREDGKNRLELLFDSALLEGKRLEEEQGFKNLFWNGDSCRMNVRKIGCHFGWDWAPTLLTCGPWRPIMLESFDVRISDLEIDIEVSDTLESARITIMPHVETQLKETTVNITLYDPQGTKIHAKVMSGGASMVFTVSDPKLWYPVGYGSQPLYRINATVQHNGHEVNKRAGLRHLELVQRPIPKHEGLTFFFKVNNIPIYCHGTDWVPGDTFLSRITPQRYRDWIELAVEGNQNMIRIWGGGLYEDDCFYDICDELGVLIWHDFMLGCGVYPVNDFMMTTIRKEAEYNLRRLRHHSCIVLWCGNNEDHMFAELHHLEYDQNDKDPENWLKTNWAARYYYDKMLKDICEDMVPRVPYWNSSPYGGAWSNDPTIGDIHSWNFWMADQPRLPYQDYETRTGRFVSEFGMKSYPAFRSIKQLITDPKERHPQSKTLDLWHCAPGDQRTIALYLIDNQCHSTSLEDYVYATQLNQAEAMDFALRAFRRLWRGPGREECAGNLIWQLNDCFPSVSWSLADSFMRPKLAYYVTKRDYAPVIVGSARRVVEHPKDKYTKVFIDRTTYVDIWGSNLTTKSIAAEILIAFFSIKDGTLLSRKQSQFDLAPNRSAELTSFDFEKDWRVEARDIAAAVHLLDANKRVIARYVDWPQPLRHLDFSSATVTIRKMKDGSNGSAADFSVMVEVTGGLAKGVELSVDINDPDVADAFTFSDNCLDLVPGEPQEVFVTARKGGKLPEGDVTAIERHYGERSK
ncbi:glycoside hydrolase family 2 protein [Rhizodiscina lignyota]|uniref:Beta-mannosidase B n=1 Tax=Rhizodiscina lignyota TaxID=1504668 RepID=A0A9P4I8A2_9PEZI|nr:glycoside hydrolase family 2 protein [Rhizodiscina lignyota]